MNVTRKPGFSQVCVRQGLVIEPSHSQVFEKCMLQLFGARVQYLEEFVTPSVSDNGSFSGYCTDLFFAVHDEDLSGFSTRRLQMGGRWVEDVLWSVNYHNKIYPDRVFGYRTWDPEPDAIEDAELVINKIYYDHLRPPSVRMLSRGMIIVQQFNGGKDQLNWVPGRKRI